MKPKGRNAFANLSMPAQSTGSPPLMVNRTRPRSTSDTSRAYLPIMLYAMFGAAVSVIPLSLSQRSQRNGDAVNAEVGASQTGDPLALR